MIEDRWIHLGDNMSSAEAVENLCALLLKLEVMEIEFWITSTLYMY